MSRLAILAGAAALSLSLTGLGLTSSAWAQSAAIPGVQPITAGANAPAPNADYRIGPLDTLQVEVFEVADMSGEVKVDNQGQIQLPLLGKVPAQGKTAMELSAELQSKLGEKYIKNPQVTVAVKDAQGQRVTVDGDVTHPGVYPLKGPTTLIQAVALANGADMDRANLHHVTVYRVRDGQVQTTNYDLTLIRKGKAPDPEIQGKDIVVVGHSNTRDTLKTVGAVLPIALLFAW